MVVFRKKNKKTTATRDSRKEEKTRSRCGRGTSIRILFGVVLISVSLFLTGWYHNKVNISLSSINDKIDPSFLLSSSNSNIISSSQKQVVGVVEKRSNTTIMEEAKLNNNLDDSDTTVDNDFDLSLSQYECGTFKCFIPSKSNQDIGYLVKVISKKRKKTMPEMIVGWQLAQWIDEHFGDLPNGLHRHFYIDEPFIIQLNKTVAKKLNKILRLALHPKEKFLQLTSQQMKVGSKFVGFPVQKVKRIRMDDFLFYKCEGKLYTTPEMEEEYINNAIKMGNGIKLYKNLEESYNILQTFFILKPIILIDFHALFDQNGNIYFTDLDTDSLGDLNQIERTKKCLDGIDRLMNKSKSMIANTTTQKEFA